MASWLSILVVPLLASVVIGGNTVVRTGKARSADQVEIVYSVVGRGEPALVFIHGGFADRSFWDNQLRHFAGRHKVIAIDLAGHGASGANRRRWSLPAFGEDVRAVIEKENVKRAVILGNSLGGPVAMETARLLPRTVAMIVAVDTCQDLTQQAPEEYLRAQARAFRSDFIATMKKMIAQLFHPDVDPALAARVEKVMLDNRPEMAAALMESFIGYDEAALAKQLAQPIRCINGDLFPTDVAKNRTVHRDFDAVILPHTGHYPMLEKPAQFNTELERLLAELARRQ